MGMIALMVSSASLPAAAETSAGNTVIFTTMDAEYSVTIPADTAIAMNVLSTPISSIGVEIKRIDIGKQVIVSADSDGKLENIRDDTETIAYTLRSGGEDFQSAAFTDSGTKALTIDIAQAAWDAAASGDYTDTITFRVSYAKIL